MSRVAAKIKDKRLLRLIRRYLNAGIMTGGTVSIRKAGTAQGSPLSPLLSNILLDDLDRELERRGHNFCRYADDTNVYVRSQRAGHRVMASLMNFLENRMLGWVGPILDYEALRTHAEDAIYQTLDKDTWSIRTDSAIRRIHENFSIELMSKEYDDLWASVLDKSA